MDDVCARTISFNRQGLMPRGDTQRSITFWVPPHWYVATLTFDTSGVNSSWADTRGSVHSNIDRARPVNDKIAIVIVTEDLVRDVSPGMTSDCEMSPAS